MSHSEDRLGILKILSVSIKDNWTLTHKLMNNNQAITWTIIDQMSRRNQKSQSNNQVNFIIEMDGKLIDWFIDWTDEIGNVNERVSACSSNMANLAIN